jgi:2-oxoglutarate ferredoxin oxidoreductase subunit beta
VTSIILNNSIYGMTGGQYSPTTPYGMRSSTTVYSNIEQAFKISELAVTAGAVFVGRGTVYQAKLLDGLIEKAILKPGFSVVEVIAHCHTQYGRQNRLGSAVEMMEWQRDHAVTVEKAASMVPEALQDKIVIGVLVDKELPVYQEEYEKIRERAKATIER